MTLPDELGRAKSCAMSTPSITLTDLLSMDLEPDHESHEHTGNKRFKRTNIGNDATKLVVKTTDAAVLALRKDAVVTSVTAIWRSVDRGVDANNLATGAADYVTFTCSAMRVAEAVKIAGGGDGKAAEYDVTLEACQTAAGADPTMTIVVGTPTPPGP